MNLLNLHVILKKQRKYFDIAKLYLIFAARINIEK